MSNRTKMQYSNGKVRRLLAASGFKDIHFFPHLRFGGKDIYFRGLGFDGCSSFGKRFVLFQVKSNLAPSKKIQENLISLSKDSGCLLFWFDVMDRKGIKAYGANCF